MGFWTRLFGIPEPRFSSKKRVSSSSGGKTPESWSWYLREDGELRAWEERHPTEEAAVRAAEAECRDWGGANWRRDHPYMTVMIKGPNNHSYTLGGRRITKI
jgi:hypothetical protein